MRAVVQRVLNAGVTVDGECVGKIGRGYLVLLGVGHGDTRAEADKLWGKLRGLRINEDENGKTKPYVLHAEANAITKVAKSANNCDGSTLYITAAPCIECSKLIIQAGIKRVVYCEKYRSEEGLDLLRKVGIECIQREIDER